MGTSKSNSGPSQGTPILPDWADKPENGEESGENQNQNNQNPDEPNQGQPLTGNFGNVRSSFTSYIKSPSTGRLKRAISSYVGASGGSKVISNSALGGKRSAVKLASFLSDVIREGSQKAFEKIGIDDLEGLSANKAFTKLSNFLSPTTNLSDEPYARSAVSEVLSKIFERFELEERDLSELDNITPELALEFTEIYIAEYIIDRLMSELGKTLYDKEYNQREVLEREYEIKEFVNEQVKLELMDVDYRTDGFSENEGKKIIDNVFEYAYSILES
jgi:hypothetical protein